MSSVILVRSIGEVLTSDRKQKECNRIPKIHRLLPELGLGSSERGQAGWGSGQSDAAVHLMFGRGTSNVALPP
jgi:hypothetical protein